jgi:signal transduction histidine kinase
MSRRADLLDPWLLTGDIRPGEEELLHRVRWFTRVRWLFLAGLCFAIVTGIDLLRMPFPYEWAIGVAAFLAAYNGAFVAYHRSLGRRGPPSLRSTRIDAGMQIALDLVVLTTLVHLGGGAENPFVSFYLFHVIVGSLLLQNREAWLVAVVAVCLFTGVVLLEYYELLPHYHVDTFSPTPRHQKVEYLVIVCVAFLVTTTSTVSIACSIVNGLRLREQQLVVAQKALLRKSEDLQRANAVLKQKQTQLVQTEKQAALGELVAGIAHEINNPIQFIHGNMAVLAEALGDMLPVMDERAAAAPGVRVARLEYPFFRKQFPVLLEDMKNGAARIGAIVRDLKTFARRDEGRLDETVDLNAAVEASLRLLRNRLRKLRVEEDLEPTLPKLKGNLTQLEQVVVNTVLNAAQALGDQADGAIRVRTRSEDGGQRIRLSIQDNGPGIPPAIRERIFDPFFTTKQRSGGTGLGLSITYGIVQQHHGEIQVDTEVGAGTTFHYLLPIARDGNP